MHNLSDETWNATNWKLGVDYDVNPTSMLYAQASTGYKAGGYFDGLPPNAYTAPEHITAYREVGSKNRFFDRAPAPERRRLPWSNTGISASLGRREHRRPERPGHPQRRRKAVIYGVEVESDFKVSCRADSVDLNLSWLHGRCDVFTLPLGEPFVNNAASADHPLLQGRLQPGLPRSADFSGCHGAHPRLEHHRRLRPTFELANEATLTGADPEPLRKRPRTWNFTASPRTARAPSPRPT
ncbi:TonB-dependent receptor domain-containing protein [Caulobacter segnis]